MDLLFQNEALPKKIKYRARRKSKSKVIKKRRSSRIKCENELVCNYGTFPIKTPMLIDDYDFKFKGNFIEHLDRIYKNIFEKNPPNQIQSAPDKNPKTFLRDIMTAYLVSNIFQSRNQNKLIHIINKIMKI